MKIAIITLPLQTNYGGILQAYALQFVLKKMGHEVSTLNGQNTIDNSFFHELLSMLKYSIKKYIYDSNYIIFFGRYKKKYHSYFTREINRFVTNNIQLQTIDSFNSLNETDFDAYIIGSDQVWRPSYFQKMWGSPIENAFLSFTDNWSIKRIAYAASFGGTNWEYTNLQTKNCGKLLSKFEAISVREQDAVEIIRNKFNLMSDWVLDPTFLLSQNDYLKLIDNWDSRKEKIGIFEYVLDENLAIKKFIERIACEYELPITQISTNLSRNPTSLKDNSFSSVEFWLKCFRDADIVITDSFHACVFSIIFRKRFIVVQNKNRGLSRFETLLSKLNLNKNIVCNFDIPKDLASFDIPEQTYELLKVFREQSIEFLNKNLKI